MSVVYTNGGTTVKPALDEDPLEHELTQQVVKETVTAAMQSPLRDPILEALEESGEVRQTEKEPEAPGSSRLKKAVQGLTVFAVTFGLGYFALRKLTGDGEALTEEGEQSEGIVSNLPIPSSEEKEEE